MASSEIIRKRWCLAASERRLALIFGDFLSAVAATYLSLYLWAQLEWLGISLDFIRSRAERFIFIPIGWLILMVNNSDVNRAGSWRETLCWVAFSGAVGVVVYLVAYFTSAPGSLPRRDALYLLILFVLVTILWRWIYIRSFTARGFMRRTLIIGAGDSSQTLLCAINTIPSPPFNVVGLIDDDADKLGKVINGYRVLGNNQNLMELAKDEEINDLIIAILGPMNGEMFEPILDAQEQGVAITRMPLAHEELLGRLPIKHLESDWLVRSFVDEIHVSPLYALSKRLLDLLGGMVGVLILALIYPWVARAIIIESTRLVIYIQERLGQWGKPYGSSSFERCDRMLKQTLKCTGRRKATHGLRRSAHSSARLAWMNSRNFSIS
ncbi:MAG: hypothetical protein E4G99_01570 [Anaerolineales bacterium]|nr:MAG: hypothetical protein E4G99_01570 [Anaerolineales bacterium]